MPKTPKFFKIVIGTCAVLFLIAMVAEVVLLTYFMLVVSTFTGY